MRLNYFFASLIILFGLVSSANAHNYPNYNPNHFSYESWLYDYDRSPLFRVIPPDPTLVNCEVTPQMELDDKGPKAFPHTNNLAKPVGGADYVDGQLIVVSIRVVDKNCVPVPDAVLSIWQKNSFGYYQYYQDPRLRELKLPDMYVEDFTGAGKATTDNMGFANFLTIYPDYDSEPPSYINVRVNQKDMDEIQTMFFLADYEDNDQIEKSYLDKHKGLKISDLPALTAFAKRYYDEFGTYLVYFYTITFDQEIAYKHY